MPKYYLHLWDGHLFEADQEGTDLPDLASAREEALRFANEIRCDLEAPDRALIQIADAAGSVLWMIQLSRTADRPRCRG